MSDYSTFEQDATCVACGDYTLQGVLCPACKDVPEFDGTNSENPFAWRPHERRVAPSVSSQLVAREARQALAERGRKATRGSSLHV